MLYDFKKAHRRQTFFISFFQRHMSLNNKSIAELVHEADIFLPLVFLKAHEPQ